MKGRYSVSTPQRERSVTRDLVTLAAAVVVIVGMKLLATVVVPVMAAMFLFVAFLPMLRWLERKRVRRGWAKVIVIATVLAGVLLVIALIVISVAQITEDLPEHRSQIQQHFDDLASDLSAAGIDVSGEDLGAQFDLETIVGLAIRFLPGMISAISGAVLALLVFIYAVIDADGIRRRLWRGIGADDAQLSRLGVTMSSVSDYIRIRALLGGVAALLNIALLLLLGVPYALLWGLLSFVMSFIPYVGYWVALVPPLLLALSTGGWEPALVVFLGYWAINGTIDNLIGPRLLGHGLNIAPAVAVISIVFWGFVLGPVGAIIAMPLTVGFKLLLLERSPDSHWLALLISARDSDTHEIPQEAVPGHAGAPTG
jgi:predicted PurR-regulated permease PerM